jgi:predicted dehydrogenase
MIQAAAERDLSLGVNFMMRYGPLALPVREVVQSGVLGAPLRGNLVNRAGDGGLAPDHWFWDEAESGGIFVEHGVHFFDLVRSWLGEGRVLSAMRMRRPGTDIIDQVAAEVRYGDQATVNFYHGFHQSSLLDEQSLSLIFERGSVTLYGWVAAKVRVHGVLSEEQIECLESILPDAGVDTLTKLIGDHRTSRRGRLEPVDREVRLTWQADDDKQTIYSRALRELMADTVASVRDRRHQPRVTAHDGRTALEIALDADRLARGTTP